MILQLKDALILQVKDASAIKPMTNGKSTGQSHNRETKKQGNGVIISSKTVNNNNVVRLLPLDVAAPVMKMSSTPLKMEPIHESGEEQRTPQSSSGSQEKVDSNSDDILNDEIDLLDEMKSDDAGSPKSLHKNINELVLKTQQRY